MIAAILLGVFQIVLILLGITVGLSLFLGIVVLIACLAAVLRPRPSSPHVVADRKDSFV